MLPYCLNGVDNRVADVTLRIVPDTTQAGRNWAQVIFLGTLLSLWNLWMRSGVLTLGEKSMQRRLRALFNEPREMLAGRSTSLVLA